MLPAGPVDQTLLDQGRHDGAVTAPEALGGGRHHLLARHSAPIELETGLERQLPNELPLCAAVAVAEWVDGVNLAQVMAGAGREGRGSQAREKPLSGQLSQPLVQRRFDESGGSEELSALRDF